MIVFLLVLIVLAVGVTVAVVLGRSGGMSISMANPVSTMGGRGLPVGIEVTSEALGQVRFDRTFRGYRMDQVDAVLDRLRADLADREARLAEFASAAGGSFPVVSFDEGFDPFAPPKDL